MYRIHNAIDLKHRDVYKRQLYIYLCCVCVCVCLNDFLTCRHAYTGFAVNICSEGKNQRSRAITRQGLPLL